MTRALDDSTRALASKIDVSSFGRDAHERYVERLSMADDLGLATDVQSEAELIARMDGHMPLVPFPSQPVVMAGMHAFGGRIVAVGSRPRDPKDGSHLPLPHAFARMMAHDEFAIVDDSPRPVAQQSAKPIPSPIVGTKPAAQIPSQPKSPLRVVYSAPPGGSR